jgi:FkbM family methyltransferase
MRDGFLRLIVIDGAFEKDFFRIADSLLAGGGTFVDVGANHGLLSLGLAGRFANNISFHLFEPNAHLRETIRRSLKTYPSVDFTINPEALSDHEGAVQFHFQEGHLGMSHVVESGGTPIRSTTFDAYAAAKGIASVELMKIDVEGYELAVLNGSRKSLAAGIIKAIYFEYSEKWLRRHHDPSLLLTYLAEAGFEVCFCREDDVAPYASNATILKEHRAVPSIPLVPVRGLPIPAITDLLAVPRNALL